MGEYFGLRPTLLVAGVTSILSLAFLLLSQVWGIRQAAPRMTRMPWPD